MCFFFMSEYTFYIRKNDSSSTLRLVIGRKLDLIGILKKERRPKKKKSQLKIILELKNKLRKNRIIYETSENIFGFLLQYSKQNNSVKI